MDSEEKLGFKRTEIGLIPEDWAVEGFSGVLESSLRNGLTKPTPVRGKGVKMVNMGELFQYDRIKNADMERVPLSESERKIYLLQSGDLLFARQSLLLSGVGKCSIFLGDAEDVTFEGHLIRAKINKKRADPAFFYYFFHSSLGRSVIEGYAEQVAAAGIRGSDLKKVPVPVPPLAEQVAIAGTLSSFDSMIELNEKMNKTLEAIGRAIFKRWFVDFEFPNEEGKPYKSSGGELVDAGEIGKEIPKGWKVGRIEDVADVVGGGTPSTRVESYFTNTGIHWLTPKDLSGFEGKFIDKGAIDITEEGLKNSSAKLMPKGTILFTSRAPIGYVAIALNSITTNQGFKSLIPKNKMQTEYLYQYLRMKTPYIQSISCGSTFGEISGKAMKGIEMIIPEKLMVEKFEEFMAPINSRIINNRFGVRTLKEIRDSLLPRLMSGRMRIPVEERTADNR